MIGAQAVADGPPASRAPHTPCGSADLPRVHADRDRGARDDDVAAVVARRQSPRFPEPAVEEYRQFARLRIDAVNHALAGIPEDKVSYYLCWGSWHGPHTHDLPLEHIIDLILEVKAQTYSFEAANVRHKHEWWVWQNAKLPPGKMLMPGVVSHATNLIEHPQLVADRILRYAAIAGREHVIAGTNCGLGGRSTPTSPGPNCAPSPKAPASPRNHCGLDEYTTGCRPEEARLRSFSDTRPDATAAHRPTESIHPEYGVCSEAEPVTDGFRPSCAC
jgi:hypothetical protein